MRALHAPTRSGPRSMPHAARLVQRVEHLAVDVELELAACAALPTRTGAEPS